MHAQQIPFSLQTSPSFLIIMAQQQSSNINGTRRQYRSRLSSTEKLDKAFSFLRTELNWSLSDLIKTLCEQDDPKNRQRQAAYMKTAYSRDIIDLCANHPRSSELQLRDTLLDSVEWGIPEYRQEVRELGKQAGFAEYAISPAVATDIDSLHGILDAVRGRAPRLLELLDGVTSQSRRSSEMGSYSSRYVVILAILCYSQSNRHNNVQTLIGRYMHSNGVRRRVIELLSKCALSVSYSTVIRGIKASSDNGTTADAAIDHAPDSSVAVHDNSEPMEDVREHPVEGDSTFDSATAGEALPRCEVPEGGLAHGTLDSSVRLEPENVLLAPQNSIDDVQPQM